MPDPASPGTAARPAPVWLFAAIAAVTALAVLYPGIVVPGIAAFVAVAAMAISFVVPATLVYVVLLTSPFAGLVRNLAEFSVAGMSISLSGLRWAAVGALAAAVAAVSLRRVDLPRPLIPLGLFAAWMAVRWAGSGGGTSGINDVVIYGLPVILASYAATVFREATARSIRRVEQTIIASIFIPVALYAALLPTPLMSYTANGPKGIMNPRPVASFLLICLAVALANLRYARTRVARVLTGFMAALAVATIVFTASRMASAVAILMIAMFGLDARRLLRSLIRLLPRMALVGVLGVVVVASVPNFRDRFFYRIPASIDEAITFANLSGRDVMWTATWNNAIQRPLLGWGPGAARPLVALALEWGGGKIPPEEYPPHNEYLQVFHDGGIVGLALLLWAWVVLMRHLIRGWRDSSHYPASDSARLHLACVLGAIVLLISAVIDNTFHYTTITAPLFILIGCAWVTLHRQELGQRGAGREAAANRPGAEGTGE